MNHSTMPIQVFRGDYIESTHDIHIAVVTAKGDLLAYYGDSHRYTFARSSMKPFQALPIVESGAMKAYNISDKELSLFCASHNGESFHRESVRDVLGKLQLEEEHLKCGTHIPIDIDSYNKLIKNGGELTPLYSNCSGKHTGMLAGVLKQGMELSTYNDLEHPYQQQIIDIISDVSSYDKQKIVTSVDGCGVPVHRLPLYNLALSFARLAQPNDWVGGSEERKNSLEHVSDAMAKYPEMVAGTNRFDTDLMSAFGNRIVAKGGAEGIHCFADKQTGTGIAIKVEDGNDRGASVASMEVLKQLNIGDKKTLDQLATYLNVPILNTREEKIGEVNPSFQLNFL